MNAITDFQLLSSGNKTVPNIRQISTETNKILYTADYLWTAPELLSSVPERETKDCDIYSFGIILHEIFYRMGTFSGYENMTVKGNYVF